MSLAGTALSVPLIAYRGLWDKFAGPETISALTRAYARGIPSLVRVGPGLPALRDVVALVSDPTINRYGEPVYLVTDEPPPIERVEAHAPTLPPVFAVTPGTRHADLRPVSRWDPDGWTPAGVYVPVCALLDSRTPTSLAAATRAHASPLVLVESLNVIDDIAERSRFECIVEHRAWDAIRSAAGSGTRLARVSDMVELDQLQQRIREAA